MKSIVRFGAVVAMAAAMVVGFAGSASADEPWLNVDVHVRACPSDVENWFEDCHDNPVEGFYFDETDMYSDCTTGEDGNCSFQSDYYGYIYWTEPVDYVYCSVEDPASDDAVINVDNPADAEIYFPADIESSYYVCDLYIIDDSLVPADGAALPDTGAGMSEQGANLGLLLAGVVALGGLAVASRRAAVR